GHGAQARHLPQRDPGQQHRDRSQDHHRAEAQRQVLCRTLVEYVPGRGADRAADHQRHGQAVEPQADAEPEQALGHAPGAQLGERAEVGQGNGSLGRGHAGILPESGYIGYSHLCDSGCMQRALSPARLAALVGDFDRSPAWLGLHRALRELIGDGRIPVGTRLPSERAGTSALGVSRSTVSRAYAELIDAGFATARQGSGTYAAVPVERRRAHDHVLQAGGMDAAPEGSIDLSCASGSASPGVAAAYDRALAALPSYLCGSGYLPSGLPELQAVIADWYA